MATLLNIAHEGMLPHEIRNILSDEHLVFPSLTNAHDHLEFNLFPTLVERYFSDYIEWGEWLHKNQWETINRVLKVPLEQRIRFGLLKNLLNGFGGVVHHGLHQQSVIAISTYPVFSDYKYIHSIATDKRWKLKLNLSTKPVMVHAGEGTSQRSIDEIEMLLKHNYLGRKIIPIHAIRLKQEQAKKLHAVIWCPLSNLNLYNATMDAKQLHDQTKILFGTDSTLTASANFWDHIRIVKEKKLISDDVFFKILFESNDFFFGNENSRGWVVAKKNAITAAESFFNLSPEDIDLVWIKGEAWLSDDRIGLKPKQSIPLQISGKSKWVKKELANVVAHLEKQNVALPLPLNSI